MSGQAVVRADISGVSLAEKCEITTSTAHGLSTGNWIRVTDLGNCGPATDRGMNQINNKEYTVYVTSSTTFQIKNPITDEYINSTDFTPWVAGGQINLEQTSFQYEGD